MKTPVTAQQREAMSCFNDVVASFKAAMRNAGIEPKNEIIANGRLQRDHIIGHRLTSHTSCTLMIDRAAGFLTIRHRKAKHGRYPARKSR